MGGPRREPVVRDMYTMRSIRIDPTISVSGNVIAGGSKTNRVAIGTMASRLGMKKIDVTKKSGIYPYVLTGDEKYLSIRLFTDAQKQKTYEKQKGLCKFCKKPFDINQMEADHIKPWHEGGKTIEENCQMLCKDDNRRKSGS